MKSISLVFAVAALSTASVAYATQGAGPEAVPSASFGQLDINQNGVLDRQEFAQFKDPNYTFDFNAADKNKDENLSKEEWQVGLRGELEPGS